VFDLHARTAGQLFKHALSGGTDKPESALDVAASFTMLERNDVVEWIGTEVGVKPPADRSFSKPEPVRSSPPTDDNAEATDDEVATFPLKLW
jgi:hypothetical protein